jgi:hypothetical protein
MKNGKAEEGGHVGTRKNFPGRTPSAILNLLTAKEIGSPCGAHSARRTSPLPCELGWSKTVRAAIMRYVCIWEEGAGCILGLRTQLPLGK